MTGGTEFARLVPLARLGAEPLRRHIAASEAECAALARRFELVALDRLEADVELVRERGGTILLSAAFAAEFAQSCIVTLDPVPGRVAETFRLRYGPPDAESGAPGGEDDPAFEPLESDAIDVGEAVAQEFSLALPAFPRTADAALDPPAGEEDSASEAFAALSALLPREGK